MFCRVALTSLYVRTKALGETWRRRVHTGVEELLTAHKQTNNAVSIVPNSIVELSSGFEKIEYIRAPWHDVTRIWDEHRSMNAAQSQKLYGAAQNKLIFWPEYSNGSTQQDTVLSFLAASLRMHVILPFWQFGEEYIMTPGTYQSIAPVRRIRPRRHFSLHAWGDPASDVSVQPSQSVTVFTQTWLEPDVESIQMPWSKVGSCMNRVAAYTDEECEEEFPLNDEDLGALTHYYENGWELSQKRQDEGREVLCVWHALGCRRYNQPFRIDILGRPHILQFR